MKSIKIFLCSILFISVTSYSQTILNAESLRVDMLKGSESWSGFAGLSFGFVKNTTDNYNVSTNLAFGYNGGENLWMIISNIYFDKSGDSEFQNSGVQHFRYNRQISETVTFEAFLQGQYDAISRIDFRGLIGVGPRFDLSKKKDKDGKKFSPKSRIFIGTLVMYEYEKSSELDIDVRRKDLRGSNYLSFSLYPSDKVTIISTTYYQPKLNMFKDYRISSVLGLEIGLGSSNVADEKKESFWDKLSFNVNFSYNYDAFPVVSIPKTQYSLTNGLSFNF